MTDHAPRPLTTGMSHAAIWREHFRDPWHVAEALVMAAVPLTLVYLYLR